MCSFTLHFKNYIYLLEILFWSLLLFLSLLPACAKIDITPVKRIPQRLLLMLLCALSLLNLQYGLCALWFTTLCILLLLLMWGLQMFLWFHFMRDCRLIFNLPLSVRLRLSYWRMKLNSLFNSSCQPGTRQTAHYWKRIRTICLESFSKWISHQHQVF